MKRSEMLLRLARESIDTSFRGARPAIPPEPWLAEFGASFVTLRTREDGELRGCVGSVEAHRPLGEDVVDTARSAAFRDTRFDPLERHELDAVTIDISVLSPLAPFPVRHEADAIDKLARTKPGLLLEMGYLRGLFLPKVWESLPDPREFLAHLKEKAGLPADYWSSRIELKTFTCEEFGEDELRDAART